MVKKKGVVLMNDISKGETARVWGGRGYMGSLRTSLCSVINLKLI